MARNPNSGNVGIEMEIDKSNSESDINRKEISDDYGRQFSNVHIEKASFKERVLDFFRTYGVYMVIITLVILLIFFAE